MFPVHTKHQRGLKVSPTIRAWWAFNHLGTLAAQRWGDMRHDVSKVWHPWQQELFVQQPRIEAESTAALPAKARPGQKLS